MTPTAILVPRCESEPATVDSPNSAATSLGGYVDPQTERLREIVGLPRPNGSIFVLDRLAGISEDARVLALLSPDEPAENAGLVASLYLADEQRGRCRLLTPEDLARTRPPSRSSSIESRVLEHAPLLDGQGGCFRIRELSGRRSLPELRWARSRVDAEDEPPEILTLRDVIGCLEDYEPARSLTIEAVDAYGEDPSCSTCTLDAELRRLNESSIVLNRGIREAVHAAVAHRGLSMSEIALRCGRTKHDRPGWLSGESSWLARRIGQIPESAEHTPSPWVHSDVLALIARDGLGVCPCEVELG